MHSLRNKNVNPFPEAILLCTYAFRLFVVYIIATFIFTQYGMVASVIWGTAVALTMLILDFFFTIRRFWECSALPGERWIGMLYKSCLIALVASYAIFMYLQFPYWLYGTFGMLVAAIIAFDFLLEQYRRLTSKQNA